MSEMSEKAIKLINNLRRDISIDIMFTPEKNAEDDSLKALMEYIAELESAQRWHVVADGELPEHDGEYWVWLEAWNTPNKRGACIYSKDYHDNNGFFNLIPVTHWMHLPTPPEERER